MLSWLTSHVPYKDLAKGSWSLPNGLGGGDLDGYVFPPPIDQWSNPKFSDMYEVIQYGDLLVPEHQDPASYAPVAPFKLDRPSTIDDVCDFIVEYINSDVVVCASVSSNITCGAHDEENHRD